MKMLKNLTLLATLSLILFFGACCDDDDKNNNDNDNTGAIVFQVQFLKT